MKKYPVEIREFIIANVLGRTAKELTGLINAEFGTNYTVNQIRGYKKNHKMPGGLKGGYPAGLPTKLWPAEIKDFILDNHVGIGPKDMTVLINGTFGTNYTQQQLKSYYHNHHINSGLTGYYTQGHIPANKGKKGIRVSKETEFKPGHAPHNSLSVGTEILRADGYLWIKIAEPNKWKQKHYLVWEEAHGPVPKNHVLIFANTDRLDIRLDNLILITLRQRAVMCKKGLFSIDPEATKAGINVANVYLKLSELKKRKKIK